MSGPGLAVDRAIALTADAPDAWHALPSTASSFSVGPLAEGGWVGLVALLLATFGLAYVVGHSKISLGVRVLLGGADGVPTGERYPDGSAVLGPPRKPLIPGLGPWLVELMECPACFGMWCGFAFGLWSGWGLLPAGPLLLHTLVYGCMVSGAHFLLGRATGLL